MPLAQPGPEQTRATALLLTGQPGVGKTTVLKRVADGLAGRSIGGFTTGEIRERGERVGFRLENFGGHSALLAHVAIRSGHKVGRYGVDLAALERVVDEALDSDSGAEVYLVDEIGKMECLSSRFVGAMERLLDSGVPTVATVASKGAGLIERVKQRPDVRVLRVTRGNRESLHAQVLDWLMPRLR
jgi:nucleoside-triphosphatase